VQRVWGLRKRFAALGEKADGGKLVEDGRIGFYKGGEKQRNGVTSEVSSKKWGFRPRRGLMRRRERAEGINCIAACERTP